VHRCVDHGPVPLLVGGEEGDELVPVRQGPPDDLVGGVLVGPPPQRRVLSLRHEAHPGHLLQHAEPVRQRAGGEVDEAEVVAAEEPRPAAAELRVQHRQARLRLRGEPRPRLAVGRPHRQPQRLQALGGDEVGPEAGGGAGVGVGGQDPDDVAVGGGGGEGLVDVLDDEEGLADGAAGVEEHRDGAVDGVVRQQEVALGGQVLHQQLVRHPLERQRHLHAVRERAAERRDQLHRLRRLRHLLMDEPMDCYC